MQMIIKKKAKAFEEFKEKMQKEKELLAQEFEKRLNSTNVKREEELAKIKAAFDLSIKKKLLPGKDHNMN